MAIPLYLIIRLISPIKIIRFGSLKSYRIGHFAGNIEMYLCEKHHGIQPKNSLDFFYVDPKYNYFVCNHQLLKMWKRVLHVHWIAYYLHWINARMPDGRKHIAEPTINERDVYGLMEKSPIHLSFTPEEELKAQDELRKMGIEKENPFVCMLARDNAYLNATFPNKDWSYHRFRDCNIQDYLSAADWLTGNKYFVVRMGAVVRELMQTDNPKIIEYAHNGFRTDLLDIYLGANCDFFISCGVGIEKISTIFRKPILYVNFPNIELVSSWESKSITIFKKLWLKKEKRFMKFKEILECGAGRFHYKYEENGIEFIENTPEEILDATIEMDRRLKGTWKSTDEDEERQRRFWALFKPNELNRVFRSRIGASYLRDYHELID